VLDWLASKISTWVVGLFNDKVVDAVNHLLQEKVAEILPSVDPTIFFG
jgi:hypothetical protein